MSTQSINNGRIESKISKMIFATIMTISTFLFEEISCQVSTSDLLTHSLTAQAVTAPITLHEMPKTIISSLSPKTLYVLDTAASNILTFE